MKKRRKLLIQAALIIIPIFVIMMAAVAYTVYISSVNSYLKAQEKQLRDIMNNVMFMMGMVDRGGPDDDTALCEWTLQQLEEFPYSGDIITTDEENEAYNNFSNELWDDTLAAYKKMPDDIKRIHIKGLLHNACHSLYEASMSESFDSILLVSADRRDRLRILVDFNEDPPGEHNGDHYDMDISQHPALEELLNSNSDDMTFEKGRNFPISGSCYIGYFPIKIDGKTRAVFGVSYKCDKLQRSVMNLTINAIIIIALGMIFLMLFLLLFLYRKAISPVSHIQTALIDYTKDKNSKDIVKKMYDIKANNELGYLADTISDLAMEIDHYTKQNIRIAAERERAQKELYEAKVQIMVSQIRPHFMYNTLSSIAMLCKLDPETAYKAAITFSDYLRGNMDSLKQTAPVPFSKELEHLKKYLYIEKLRFDDMLNIEYDIQTTDFEVPQLSVQPLVENAVKHGVGMKEDGGTVKIATRETDTAYEIIISDDGVGFDTSAPKKDDGRSHVGMENTRKRLKDMCNADIVIESSVGAGTTARVIIPKTQKEDTEL